MADFFHPSTIIIGAGQAGAQTVMSLRAGGDKGPIMMIGEEPAPPYQRPPLSKAYLKGELAEERLYFKPHDWYADNNVTLRTSTRVVEIDRASRTLSLTSGDRLSYEKLVIATGARPRALPVPGAGLGNVFDVRTLADVDRMRPEMVAGRRLVIIGAGYIGLEAAAVARQLRLEVTVLEMAERILARVASETLSQFFEDEHTRQGVDIRTGAQVVGLEGEGEDGPVRRVRLASGEALEADVVIVGIGIIPNIELAETAGLTCRTGIVVDADARTSDPNIFAAGDCCERPIEPYGRQGRLESVHNAIEQGKLAAAAILGAPRPKLDCPWFWSDQYDLKLQMAGLSAGHDQMIVRGEISERKFALFYMTEGRLIAVDAVNSPPEFMVAKKLIMERAELADAALEDTSTPIKALLSP